MINLAGLCLAIHLAVGLRHSQIADHPNWTPPANTSFPKGFTDATAFLLQHGLADPRGGKLVSAKVNGSEFVGWLVPAKKSQAAYLVGLSGLEYRKFGDVENVGAEAIEEHLHPIDQPMNDHKSFIVAALLLVHGDVVLAAQHFPVNRVKEGDSAIIFEYLLHRLGRATGSFANGDDATAFSDATSLRENRAAFEQQVKDGQGSITTDSMFGVIQLSTRVSDFFQFVDELAVDAARRVRAGSPGKPDLAAIAKLPTAQRIAKLVDALDHSAPTMWVNPGGQFYFGEPILKALADEGTAAVEPLLDAFEHDKRLTRSEYMEIRFPTAMPESFIPVHSVVWAALRQTHMFVPLESSGVPPTIDQLRTEWQKSKGLTPAEAWMKILGDDTAGTQAWSMAAARLVDPIGTDPLGFPSTLRGPTLSSARPMNGEPLRARKNPSISDLLSKRAEQVTQLTFGDSRRWSELSDAQGLAFDLYRWDPKEALPTLIYVSRAAMYNAGVDANPQYYGAALGRGICARAKLGDKSALDEYGDWIVGFQSPRGLYASREQEIFRPLVEFAADTRMEKAARQLFLSAKSTWSVSALAQSSTNLIASPLLQIKAFRESLQVALVDKTVIGEAVRDGLMMTTPTMAYNLGPDPDLSPGAPEKEKTDFRICDSAALGLRRLAGVPAFQPYWPTAKRDKAIVQLATFLQANANHIDRLLRWPDNWQDFPSQQPKSKK